MYRKMGSSESSGDTSPYSDLKGAPNRRNAVGELSSAISHFTCSETSSRLRSANRNWSAWCPGGLPELVPYSVLAFPSAFALGGLLTFPPGGGAGLLSRSRCRWAPSCATLGCSMPLLSKRVLVPCSQVQSLQSRGFERRSWTRGIRLLLGR